MVASYQSGTLFDFRSPFLWFLFQCKHPGEEICAILPTYSYCEQITPQEFEEQKVSTSQAAVAELLENIIKDKNLSVKEKKKKLKQVRNLVDISAILKALRVKEELSHETLLSA